MNIKKKSNNRILTEKRVKDNFQVLPNIFNIFLPCNFINFQGFIKITPGTIQGSLKSLSQYELYNSKMCSSN